MFTVSGASKRDAFARIVAGADLPAARVTADEVLWLVDADAGGQSPVSPGLTGHRSARLGTGLLR